jgi:pimeloyl-ACP methyl ester carboxylesterase
MSTPKSYAIESFGHNSRVLELGEGSPLVFFAGIGGLPAWLPALDRLAESHRVIAPSLPGFPGSANFRHLDGFYDWVVAALDLIERLECDRFDLVGSSVGGALAAEVAVLMPRRVRKLVLSAPFGIFDPAHPSADIWAQPIMPDPQPELLCARPEAWKALWARPEHVDVEEWTVTRARAMEAAARFLFPLGATGIDKRLSRIIQPTLLIRGADDRVMPALYQDRMAAGIRGPVQRSVVAHAGHLVELDQPDEFATLVRAFLAQPRGASPKEVA